MRTISGRFTPFLSAYVSVLCQFSPAAARVANQGGSRRAFARPTVASSPCGGWGRTRRYRLSSARPRLCRGFASFGGTVGDGRPERDVGRRERSVGPRRVGAGRGRSLSPRRVAATSGVAYASRRRRRSASGRPGGWHRGLVASAAETATFPEGPAPNGSGSGSGRSVLG